MNVNQTHRHVAEVTTAWAATHTVDIVGVSMSSNAVLRLKAVETG